MEQDACKARKKVSAGVGNNSPSFREAEVLGRNGFACTLGRLRCLLVTALLAQSEQAVGSPGLFATAGSGGADAHDCVRRGVTPGEPWPVVALQNVSMDVTGAVDEVMRSP